MKTQCLIDHEIILHTLDLRISGTLAREKILKNGEKCTSKSAFTMCYGGYAHTSSYCCSYLNDKTRRYSTTCEDASRVLLSKIYDAGKP